MRDKSTKSGPREEFKNRPKDHKPTPSAAQLQRELNWMLLEKEQQERDALMRYPGQGSAEK